MKFSAVFAALATVVLSVQALPNTLLRRNNSKPDVDDVDPEFISLVTVTFLGSFYDGLSQYNETDFAESGFSSDVYNMYNTISEAEKQRRDGIIQALAGDAITPYTFKFNNTGVPSFVYESMVVHGIGSIAFASALDRSTDKEFNETLGESLNEENNHLGIILFNIIEKGWNGEFDVKLTVDQSLALIAPYVSSSSPSAPNPFGTVSPLTVSGGTINGTSSLVTPHAVLSFQYDETVVNSDEKIFSLFIGGEAEYHARPSLSGPVQFLPEFDSILMMVVIVKRSKITAQEEFITAHRLLVVLDS